MKRVLPFVAIVMLFALLLQSGGCGGKNASTTDSDGDGYSDPHDANPLDPNIPAGPEILVTGESIETAVEVWIEDHLDTISQEIGALVTDGLPIAKGVAAAAVKTALLASLHWEIVEVEVFEGGQEQLARVRFSFPLKLNLPGISEEYKIQVDYMVRVREDTVVDSYLDLDSFQME